MENVPFEEVVKSIDGVAVFVNDPNTMEEAKLLLDYAMGEDIRDSNAPKKSAYDDDLLTLANVASTSAINALDAVNDRSESEIPPVPESDVVQCRNKVTKGIKRRSYSADQNMKRRERGESYKGVARVDSQKVLVTRNARETGPVCSTNTRCVQSDRQCTKMNSETRESLFKNFWSLSNQEKGVYVKAHVDFVPPKTHTGDRFLTKPRDNQYQYHLKESGVRKCVCFSFFMNTLGLKEAQTRAYLHDCKKEKPNPNQQIVKTNEGTSRAAIQEGKTFCSEQLDALPKLESHLSRSTSDKLFLQHEFDSIRSVHRFVESKAKEANVHVITWPSFLEMFHNKKLSVHMLKKDQCDRCVKYDLKKEAGSVTAEDEPDYAEHRSSVTENRKERLNDKKRDKNYYLVFIVDVEKILLWPLIRNSSQYFMCKVQLKNWTLFDLLTNYVSCSLFDETHGGSDSHVYASLLCGAIEIRVIRTPTITYVIVWSDGCASQNRCTVVSNALLSLAIRLNITIEHKYLISGHSQNEVDAAHSRIEKCTANQNLYSPQDYAERIAQARLSEEKGGMKGNTAYEVEMVTFDTFFNFEKVNFYSSIRPGHKAGDPTVTNLRALKYTPDGLIQYKLRFSDDWQDMPHKVENPRNIISRKYQGRIPISASKYSDMLKLKSFVPEKYHELYDTLPHK
ncbi:hypothetical protein B566_EDAN013228 [Ephemera danica]|nr:hypothetical protein B566_EDAN013228 [Ephemera danica]